MHSESADLLGRGRSLLPCAHNKNVEPWWWKTNTTTPPPQKKKNTINKQKQNKTPKPFGSLLAPRSGYANAIMLFFAHLLILEYSDHHQNVISSSLYYKGPLHKISLQSVHNFLSNVVHRHTDKQTNQRYQKHNLLCQGGNNIGWIRKATIESLLDWDWFWTDYRTDSI